MAFHHPDDGVSMHVWNIGLLRDYTALYPRRLPSSLCKRFLTWSTQYFTFQFWLVSKNANIRYTKQQATSHAKHRLSGVSRVKYCPTFRQTLQLPSSRWALVGRSWSSFVVQGVGATRENPRSRIILHIFFLCSSSINLFDEEFFTKTI
jgi:hypothetical protein